MTDETSMPGTTEGTVRRPRKARLLREPLVQFVALGALLFVLYAALRGDEAGAPEPKRIELTLDDLLQLEAAFTAQWHRRPTPQEMVGLVESRVREEVLYREALALGLDRNDTIVKRRMAQKMEFLVEDVSNAREPSIDELRAWFQSNAGLFTVPGRITFRHLYFSPDRRGAQARDDALKAREQLAADGADSAAAAALGDPFMFQDFLADRSPEQLAREFGPAFARALFALPAGTWQGPVESGYGWHLVFVHSSEPDRQPIFEEVEPDVKTAWSAEQRAEAWNRAYASMRAQYDLVLPAPPDEGTKPDPGPATEGGK